MVKTRSSSASCSSSHRPERSFSSLVPRKHKRRRRTVAMGEKKKTPGREKFLRKQVSASPTSTDEGSIKGFDLSNPRSYHSRDPKHKAACTAVGRRNVRCKDESPAAFCSRKVSSRQATERAEEGCSERNSNSFKRKRKACSPRQTNNTKMRISDSAEACTEEPSYDEPKEKNHNSGWTSEQDVALQSAYFQVRPSSRFWFEVSMKVPGKTAKDCFDRFYSVHPTPATTQPRSKKISAESPIRTISFASPTSSLNFKGGRFGRGKQGLLKAHQTVRHILRKQKAADRAYEADFFSAAERLNPKDSLLHNCVSTTLSPLPALERKESESPIRTPASCPGYARSGDGVWCSTSSKLRTPYDHDRRQQISRSASQFPLLSPEVLKAEQNPSRLDRFLDILHMRRVHKRKSSSLKGSSQSQEPMKSDSKSTTCIVAAREAILMDAKEVLKTSLQPKLAIEEETCFSSDHMEDESSLLSE